MEIADNQTNEESLITLGADAVQLLTSSAFDVLANKFGYALAFGRKLPDAIRDDLASCLAEIQATSLEPTASASTITVRYLNSNDVGLFAIIECLALASNGKHVLMELVVTSAQAEKHVSLEQLSVAA